MNVFYEMILYANQSPGSIIAAFYIFPFSFLSCFSKHILQDEKENKEKNSKRRKILNH